MMRSVLKLLFCFNHSLATVTYAMLPCNWCTRSSCLSLYRKSPSFQSRVMLNCQRYYIFSFFSSLDPKQCSYKLFGIGVTSISTNHQGLVDRNQSTPRLLTLVNACNAKAVLNSLKSFFFLVFLFLVFFRFSTCIDLIFLNSFSVLYLSSI